MKTNKLLALMLSMACAIGFYSCSDDDSPKPVLQNPEVAETAKAYNSLSFEWSDVPNAVQYGYQLYDPENISIRSGVTHDKNVTLTGLKPATTYTLKVWAFADVDGDYSTPAAVEFTGTTDPLIKLAAPENLNLKAETAYSYTATWEAVENAKDYIWSIRNIDGTLAAADTITETKVSIKDLADGEYTFTVYAAAHDGYDNSDSRSANFNIINPAASSLIDEIVGAYDMRFTGTDWYLTDGNKITTWDGSEVWPGYAIITKVNDSTVAIDGLFYSEEPVNGVVDSDNMTITLELKQDYCEYYTVASIEDPAVPVVGTINEDGSITFADWAMWYKTRDTWYTYLEGTSELYPTSSKVAAHRITKNATIK